MRTSLSAIHQGETLTVQLGESGSVGDPIGEFKQLYRRSSFSKRRVNHISGTGSFTTGIGYMRLSNNPNNSTYIWILWKEQVVEYMM